MPPTTKGLLCTAKDPFPRKKKKRKGHDGKHNMKKSTNTGNTKQIINKRLHCYFFIASLVIDRSLYITLSLAVFGYRWFHTYSVPLLTVR